MKNILTFILVFSVAHIFAQVQVTFQVDMTGQTVSADGVHIAGSLNGWSTDANMLTDQGNNIYAITLDLRPGTDYEYKYLNGNAWGTEEAAPGTCTIGGNNRIFTAPATDEAIPVTPFNGCPSLIETQMVKFSVDMSGQSISGNGIHVVGNFNGWSPGATAMTETGNSIYEVTVPVLSSISVVQYKFLNGNDWGTEETPGAGCGNENNNRPFAIKDAGNTVDLPVATFNGCSNPVPTKSIVFSVNLAGSSPSADGVHVAGDFQGWNPEGTPMNDVGEENYEVAVDVFNTVMYIEYKYLNGNAWGAEETVPSTCAYNANRFKIMELSNTDIVNLSTFEFNTCNNLSVSTSNLVPQDLFKIVPTIANESILVTWKESIKEEAELMVYNVNGQVVFQQNMNGVSSNENMQINVSDWSTGTYFIQLRNGNNYYSSQQFIVE